MKIIIITEWLFIITEWSFIRKHYLTPDVGVLWAEENCLANQTENIFSYKFRSTDRYGIFHVTR